MRFELSTAVVGVLVASNESLTSSTPTTGFIANFNQELYVMRVLVFVINLFFWLWLFCIPFGILSFIGFLVYQKSGNKLVYSVILSLTGLIVGIVVAEHVRKKYGLNYFFGRIHATPELDEKDQEEAH